MMTAIILSGRTGAAFAAQLGTMQVNEEIEALQTMGLSPMEFLVMPRVIALILMIPLLALRRSDGHPGRRVRRRQDAEADATDTVIRRRRAAPVVDFAMGLVKGSVFGVLVGARRLPARDPVRAQRLGGRARSDLGGGDRHRLDRLDRSPSSR